MNLFQCNKICGELRATLSHCATSAMEWDLAPLLSFLLSAADSFVAVRIILDKLGLLQERL